jgi:hypothetical protein
MLYNYKRQYAKQKHMNARICMGDRPVVAWTVVIKPSMIPNSS